MPVEQVLALVGFVVVMTGTPGPNNKGVVAGFHVSTVAVTVFSFMRATGNPGR